MTAPARMAGHQASRRKRPVFLGPTKRELTTLRTLHQYRERKGWMPSFRDLGKEIGSKSTNWTRLLIEGLERKGLIDRLPNQSRAIRITAKGREWLAADEVKP